MRRTGRRRVGRAVVLVVAAGVLGACGGGGGDAETAGATSTTEAGPVEVTEGATASSTASEGGTTLEAQASLAADGTAALDLTVTDDLGVHADTEIDWGDDVTDGALPFGCEATDELAEAAPSDTSNRETWPHTYRTPGRYSIRVSVRTNGATCADAEAASTRFVAVVTTGHGGTNGPASPAGTMVIRDGGVTTAGQRLLSLLISTSDLDGWVHEVSIDWGDGTEAQVVQTTAGCDDPVDAYPRTVPHSGNIPQQIHPVAIDTSALPTVTVRSSGCDGSQVQEAIATYEEEGAFIEDGG